MFHDFLCAFILFQDFSLTEWKQENEVSDVEYMSEMERENLIQDLGLPHILSKHPCVDTNNPGKVKPFF